MDGGDQRAVASSDSELQRSSDVATAHSPDACADAPFPEIYISEGDAERQSKH